MNRYSWLIGLMVILFLISACSHIVVPVPDRVEEVTDEDGNTVGIYSTYEEENRKEEVYEEKDENGNWVVKWVYLTLFDEDKAPFEEQFTHQGLLSFIKRYSYENLISSREQKALNKTEFFSEGNTLQHLEEYTYDLSGRLVRINHCDIDAGEEVHKWHTAFTYEGEQREPNEERIFADGHFNENTGDETVEFCTYIYNEARQVTEKRTSGDGLNFDKVLLFEYNDQGLLVSEEYQKEGLTISTKTYLYEGETLRSIEIRDGTGKLVKKRTVN